MGEILAVGAGLPIQSPERSRCTISLDFQSGSRTM